MAIGSSVVSSVPTVGTTVDTLSKASAGLFLATQELGDIDLPLRLELRTSDVTSLYRHFGAMYKFNPSKLDVADTITKGRVSMTLVVDASLGSTITRTELLAKVRQFFGALLQAGLLEALVDGSLE